MAEKHPCKYCGKPAQKGHVCRTCEETLPLVRKLKKMSLYENRLTVVVETDDVERAKERIRQATKGLGIVRFGGVES